MHEKLPILCAFAFFVLVVGWAMTPALADHCKGKHRNEPDCVGSGAGIYNVTITGDDVLGSGDSWLDSASGNKQISLPSYNFEPLYTLNLSFLPEARDDIVDACFPNSDPSDVQLFAASIFSKKVKGMPDLQAVGLFWFDGKTKDGAVDARYALQMFGTFGDDGNWPPSGDTPDDIENNVAMTDWVMKVESTTGGARKIACTGEGAFEVGIAVERTN